MSRVLTPLHVEAGLWLALFGGLVAGIGMETDWGRQLTLPVAEAPAAPAGFTKPPLTVRFELPPPDLFLETTLRPLFVVTRRPAPPPPAADAPKPSMKRDQFILTGTTIVPDGKFAHLMEKAGNKSRVVAEGKEINGITVHEVKSDRVTLKQYDDTETLTLKTSKAPALPPPGTGAAADPAAAGAKPTPVATRRPPRSETAAGGNGGGAAPPGRQP